MRSKLINEIWGYCKHTHNLGDKLDLYVMPIAELEEILSDCIECNK